MNAAEEHTRAIREELQRDQEQSQSARPAGAPAQTVVRLEDVWLSFEQPVLRGVSLGARLGETLMVAGESGSGKSTILKLIQRLLLPDRGEIEVFGEHITELSFQDALDLRRRIGMVFQNAALFDSMTVFENVAYPLREHTDMSDEEIDARVREKLDFVDLDPGKVMHMMPAELSGGMRKRVGIARGMANNAQIMLYDEPTSGLDPLTTATITHLIMKQQAELGTTSVVVSHDIRSSFKMATKIALLADCHIVFHGTPEDMAHSDDEYVMEFLGESVRYGLTAERRAANATRNRADRK